MNLNVTPRLTLNDQATADTAIGTGGLYALLSRPCHLTGQVAGMAGAYGNIGAVTFLTVLSFVSPQIFFYHHWCNRLCGVCCGGFLS